MDLARRWGNPTKPTQEIQAFHSAITNAQLHQQLDKFWKQEDVAGQPVNYTMEEAACEEHFLKNVSRTPRGRYIVKLPIKEQVLSKVGESESIARRRLQALERRFKREPALRVQYEQFLNEYASLGHMK